MEGVWEERRRRSEGASSFLLSGALGPSPLVFQSQWENEIAIMLSI